MRVISGILKGKKILQPLDINTRPLRDLVKETIFNIIDHSKDASVDLDNAKILDLFSGTGSFGIECLSRGARKAVFVENYDKSLKILDKNIKNFNLEDKTFVFKKSVFEIDKFLKINEKFDIIFIDPPFKNKQLNEIIDKIKNLNLISENTRIIIHRDKKTKEKINQKFLILREKILGLSKIYFGKII
jgi:16S rRNA (guanine966-N2)-methyltransferase